MKFYITLFILLYSHLSLANFQSVELNLYINVNERFPINDSIYVTGDIPSLCMWKPRCLKLIRIGDYTFHARLDIPATYKEIKVQFSRGSWDTQASYTNNLALEDTKISLRKRNSFGQLAIPESGKLDFVKGIVHWRDLEKVSKAQNLQCLKKYSSQLKVEKEICVRLPRDYYQSQKRFSVIYAFDGQNLFEAHKSNFGVEWELDENHDQLVDQSKISEQVIFVGLSADARTRMSEYDYHQQGALLADFIIKDLKPFIDKKYRTKKNRESTYLMGSSMGAYLSFAIAWNHSQYFSKATALSLPGGIKRAGIYQVIAYKDFPEFPINVYFDHGDKGIDESYGFRVRALTKILDRLSPQNFNYTYKIFPYTGHHESDWARRAKVALQFLLD